jgi:plasmid stability protein
MRSSRVDFLGFVACAVLAACRAASFSACLPASLCYHAVMARQLTIRGVSEEVGRRLESVSRAKGQSVNATVIEILSAAVGVDERRRRLARYVTWNQEDLAEFNEALVAQRSFDDPLWR